MAFMSNESNSMSNKQSVLAQKKPCPYKEEQDLKNNQFIVLFVVSLFPASA